EVERHALADLGLALAPSIVIPNGAEAPTPFKPGVVSADVREIIDGGFEILSFGRISWKKALDRLIRTMAYLPNARAVIAGHDEGGEATRLRAIAQARGVADRVRFLARGVDGADKEALFAAARVFAMPSLSENFGNVVVEAMVRGLPVVVTERVGAADLVEVSGAGIVVRGGEHDFAAALATLLQSNERLAAMGSAGAVYARE